MRDLGGMASVGSKSDQNKAISAWHQIPNMSTSESHPAPPPFGPCCVCPPSTRSHRSSEPSRKPRSQPVGLDFVVSGFGRLSSRFEGYRIEGSSTRSVGRLDQTMARIVSAAIRVSPRASFTRSRLGSSLLASSQPRTPPLTVSPDSSNR